MSDLLQLRGEVSIQASADGSKAPRVEIVGYTGGLMHVPGWGNVAVDLSQLDIAAQVPILSDHDASLRGIVGHGLAAIHGGQLVVNGTLPQVTDAAKQIVELAKGGFTFQASVGVQPTRREHIAAGASATINGKTITADAAGFTLIRSGTLREISICALGADPETSVAIAAQSKGTKMSDTTTDQANDQLRAQLPENQTGITTMERVQARWGREKWNDPTGLPHERAQHAMIKAAAGQIDYADFERVLLEERVRDAEVALIRAERPKAPAIYGSSRGQATDGNILAAASLLYFGRESLGEKSYGATTMQCARDLGLRSIYDLARFALHEKGTEAPHGGEAVLKAAFSTTGLPIALGDSAGKIALNSYAEQPATWRSWCDVVPVSDFKAKKLVRLGHTVGLEELSAAGEIKHGALTETTAAVTAATFARMIAIPRQLLVNDDLSLIPQVASDFGKLAQRKVANLIYTALLANASSFFHADNANLITDPLDATGLTAALKAFRAQVDSDGEPLDIRPAVLLVCPTLESTARQLLNSEQLQRYVASGTDNAPMGNPFANLNLTLEVEPRLEAAAYTGHSATGWYLMGPPAAQVAVVAFLNGMQGPTVESADTDFNTLGTLWRCFIDIGSTLVDPKAGVFSTGAGA